MAVQVKVVHADFSKSPAPAIFHERGQPLSVAILKPQGAVSVVRGRTHGGLPLKIFVVLVYQPKPRLSA